MFLLSKDTLNIANKKYIAVIFKNSTANFKSLYYFHMFNFLCSLVATTIFIIHVVIQQQLKTKTNFKRCFFLKRNYVAGCIQMFYLEHRRHKTNYTKRPKNTAAIRTALCNIAPKGTRTSIVSVTITGLEILPNNVWLSPRWRRRNVRSIIKIWKSFPFKRARGFIFQQVTLPVLISTNKGLVPSPPTLFFNIQNLQSKSAHEIDKALARNNLLRRSLCIVPTVSLEIIFSFF